MARADKQAAVAEIAESFSESAGAVLTEYRGLTVKELQDLRRSLGANANYAVVKNTLAKLAAKEAGIDGFDDLLTGPTAIAKLADLESREVLLGKLAGAMLASLSQAVYLLNAPLAQAARLAGALEAKAQEDPSILAGGAGTPVAAEEAPAAEEAAAEETPADAPESTEAATDEAADSAEA